MARFRNPRARSLKSRQRTVPRLPLSAQARARAFVIVHGGVGDRTRWKPLFPLFAPRLTVCAMDRRGHGASGDSRNYSLQNEAEDVAAVVKVGSIMLWTMFPSSLPRLSSISSSAAKAEFLTTG